MKTYLKRQGKLLKFGNGNVELAVDRKTGYFVDIRNKTTGISHKTAMSGSWPFSLRLGDSFTPDLLKVEITPNALYPQSMRYSTRAAGGGRTLVMRYANLTATGGTRTGVAVTVEIMLRDDDDYFLIRMAVRNGSRYGITRFTSGTGGLESAQSREEEHLAIPVWNFGTVWNNPVSAFSKERRSFGYPVFGDQFLTCAWFDLYGPQGGIGLGYINRQDLTMRFNVGTVENKINFHWELFDLRKHETTWYGIGGVYPLGAGKRFRTDQWILAPHAGDWHRMADIYRTEFERAFRGDYLSWDRIPDACKNTDIRVSLYNWNSRDGGLKNRFAAIAPQVRTLLDRHDIEPGNLMPIIIGHNEDWPFYFPSFFPCCKAAGGDRAARRMCEDLKAMGVDAVVFYGHAFYNHPKNPDYVAEAETGYDHENVNWPNIGNVACVDHPEWQRLWRERWIPAYEAIGAAGIYWDQGPCQYLVCTNRKHPHGHDGLKMLASHSSGLQKLMKAFHRGFKKSRVFCHVEASCDLTGRWMDMWTCESAYTVGEGMQWRNMVRYTFPGRPAAVSSDGTPEAYCRALVEGFAIAPTIKELDTARYRPLRRYVQLRRQLRTHKACGYPHGFRDTVGLRVSNPDIVARVFRDRDGITVTYYARKRCSGIITVNPAALGFAHMPPHRIRVNLGKFLAGYALVSRKHKVASGRNRSGH